MEEIITEEKEREESEKTIDKKEEISKSKIENSLDSLDSWQMRVTKIETSPDDKSLRRTLSVDSASMNKSSIEPPKFSAGRGAILRRVPTPDLKKPKPGIGQDTDFIKQMESKRTISSEDREEKQNLSEPLEYNNKKEKEENVTEIKSEIEEEEESQKLRKPKSVKQAKVVKKKISSNRHKKVKKEEEISNFGSDYIYILIGLVVVLILTYLYQTHYPTSVV